MPTPPGSALDYFGLCATKHDPKELDPGFPVLLKQVSAQEKANLAAGGIKQQMDYCYALWGEMEDIFKEKHEIRWRSPAKQNPGLIYNYVWRTRRVHRTAESRAERLFQRPVTRDVLWIIKLLAPTDKKPKYIFHNIYLDTFCRWYILLNINQ